MSEAVNAPIERSPLQKAALVIKELRERLDATEHAQREPIAIVGLGCRFPQAEGPDAYWRLLSEGRDAIREVPADRWDLEHFYDPNPNAPGKINTRYGGFLDHVDTFDASFFGISPGEAERLDPQQRMLLEVAWHALEDAGQSPAALRGSRTGVFIGITQTDYGVMQLGGAHENIQAYTGTGNGLCFAAGRLAYVLGLHGPTFSVDTACSSSMVALHQACNALRNRECDAALVGGTQLNLTPPMQIFLSKTQSFSADGRCRTFDESAAGFVLGEGAGVIVLRRLSDALARGDQIRAVIRGSGINHDGPASGLTVPSEGAQESLLRSVYERARVVPGDIDYIEAHGTATELGDPIEVGALRAVFGTRAAEQALLLGSVKTNFGHLNAAAGIAGLIKVVLMLQHEKIAPNLHFKKPSSRVRWDGFTVRVPTELVPWPRQSRPRRGGISSFGLSGTNTHTLLEEAPLAAAQTQTDASADAHMQRPLHLLCLSARSEKALREMALSYRDCDALKNAAPLADICHSANSGRSHFACRLALPVSSIEQLHAALDTFANGAGTWAQVPRGGAGRLAFWFAAEESTDANVNTNINAVQALVRIQPRVAATLARCEAAYSASHRASEIGAALFAVGADKRAALFACQFALADLWLDWGLRPAAVAGSGIGALTALCVAGVLDLEQGFAALNGAAVDARAPNIPVYSGQDGSLLALAAQPAYRLPASVNAAATETATAIQSVIDAGYKSILVLGDTGALSDAKDKGEVVSVSQQGGALWPNIVDALVTLYLRGQTVDWKAYDAGYQCALVRLPGYPFQRQRFWLDISKPAKNQSTNQQLALQETVASETVVSTSTPEDATKTIDVATQTLPAPTNGSQDLSRLLGTQLQAAAVSINDVVAQQLAFLRGRMTVVNSAPTIATTSTTTAATSTKNDETPQSPATSNKSTDALGDWHLLRMAAASEAALVQLGDSLANAQNVNSLDSIHGTGATRSMLVHRGHDDAVAALGIGGAQRDLKRNISANAREDRSLVFMFPGVGDHYLRMAQGLYASDAVFRSSVDHCCTYLQAPLGVDLREVLYPPAATVAAATATAPAAPQKMDLRAMLGRSAAPADPAEARLNQTVHCQPLVFIIEYALGQSWLARGVQPQAMIGYSVGEYAAACLSGVIAVDDALALIVRRAQLIQALPHGVMLAVPLAESKLLPLLGDELSLCIVSTPTLCVVGGPEAAIAALEASLRRDEVVTRRLPGTHAFHSRMLAPLHDALVELVQGFTLHAPRIPYISNLTGDWITEQQASDPEYWARHTWQTVRFADGLERLLDTEARVFLEVGPGQSLGSFVLQHPAAQKLRDKIVLPSMKNRYEQQADEACFLGAWGKLWLAGCKMNE